MNNKNSGRRPDKVFDNSYNTGELENISTESITLSETYKRTFLREEYESDSVHRIKNLSHDLYEYMKGSKFEPLLDNVKIIKGIIPEILQFVLPFLKEQEQYSFAEKFYVLCELLDVKEKLIYDELPTSFKDEALKEIGEYDNIQNKQDKRKLF
jgi:hypothetical protein